MVFYMLYFVGGTIMRVCCGHRAPCTFMNELRTSVCTGVTAGGSLLHHLKWRALTSPLPSSSPPGGGEPPDEIQGWKNTACARTPSPAALHLRQGSSCSPPPPGSPYSPPTLDYRGRNIQRLQLWWNFTSSWGYNENITFIFFRLVCFDSVQLTVILNGRLKNKQVTNFISSSSVALLECFYFGVFLLSPTTTEGTEFYGAVINH